MPYGKPIQSSFPSKADPNIHWVSGRGEKRSATVSTKGTVSIESLPVGDHEAGLRNAALLTAEMLQHGVSGYIPAGQMFETFERSAKAGNQRVIWQALENYDSRSEPVFPITSSQHPGWRLLHRCPGAPPQPKIQAYNRHMAGRHAVPLPVPHRASSSFSSRSASRNSDTSSSLLHFPQRSQSVPAGERSSDGATGTFRGKPSSTLPGRREAWRPQSQSPTRRPRQTQSLLDLARASGSGFAIPAFL